MSIATARKFPEQTFRQSACLIALVVFITSMGTGCASGRFMISGRREDPLAGAPRLQNYKNPRLHEVIAHLNQNTDRIQSWRSDLVKIQTSGFSLSGKLAVEKGHRVRLVVSSPLGNEVDLGSNDERFWIWSRRMEPAFVTCKHENVDAARQRMGIPFEPQWLMQALSVAPLPTSNVDMQLSPNQDQARLIEEYVSIHGQRLRRVVQVDLRKGVVVEYGLYDSAAVPIAMAKLSGHRHDKNSGIVLPHRVSLEWPQTQMSMKMDLGKIHINPKSIPSQVWEMPEMPRYELVHLDEELDQNRIATRDDSGVNLGSVETMSADGDQDDDSLHDSELDSAGRVRFTQNPPAANRGKAHDDEWDK